jgi:hypothetical protein
MNHRDLVAQSMEELRLKTAAHDGLWPLSQADWPGLRRTQARAAAAIA